MAVESNDLREYIGLPPDSQENLTTYISAAKSKARAAGMRDFKHNAMYDLFILSLAAMYYENRGMAFSGSYQATAEENAKKMINSYVLELRHAEEDPLYESGDADE